MGLEDAAHSVSGCCFRGSHVEDVLLAKEAGRKIGFGEKKQQEELTVLHHGGYARLPRGLVVVFWTSEGEKELPVSVRRQQRLLCTRLVLKYCNISWILLFFK